MTVVNLDKITGNHLESIVATEPLKNGYFVQMTELVDGETELFKATKVTDPTKSGILLHVTPEVDPDPRKAGLKHFTVDTGDEGRAYHLTEGDRMTFTVDLFGSLPTVGSEVAPQANSFLLDTALGTESLIFKVIQEKVLGYDAKKAFTIQVMSVN